MSGVIYHFLFLILFISQSVRHVSQRECAFLMIKPAEEHEDRIQAEHEATNTHNSAKKTLSGTETIQISLLAYLPTSFPSRFSLVVTNMPKLVGRGVASSICHSFNMKAAEKSAEKTLFFAHTGTSEANLHPHLIPTCSLHEKIEMSPTLAGEPSSSLLISSPARGGPASTAFAATKQIALHLGKEQGVHDVAKIPSTECILSNFNSSSTKAPRRVSIEYQTKDPFVFDNFLPLNDLSTTTGSTSSATMTGTRTSTTCPSTSLKKSKSFSRKRSSMTNLDEEYNRSESSADPYPSSKVIRSNLKKSPSRWSNLNCLNEHAEQSTQDEMLPFHRISSSSLSSSPSMSTDEVESQEDQPTHRTVTPMAWGQFTELDQHHQDEQALEF